MVNALCRSCSETKVRLLDVILAGVWQRYQVSHNFFIKTEQLLDFIFFIFESCCNAIYVANHGLLLGMKFPRRLIWYIMFHWQRCSILQMLFLPQYDNFVILICMLFDLLTIVQVESFLHSDTRRSKRQTSKHNYMSSDRYLLMRQLDYLSENHHSVMETLKFMCCGYFVVVQLVCSKSFAPL